ncbi:hypothetical protein GUJ93_ZPchr0013g36322 [Zizania palustris]|uniref:Uncharacterized protein n=1 Tax=Zizania palustris TaxID=103762 RepID=A0A8J5X2M6_ZIZPA|nr:hypothetical protein GUJ93_ZPchr0013g36322 [Zizania palustris]
MRAAAAAALERFGGRLKGGLLPKQPSPLATLLVVAPRQTTPPVVHYCRCPAATVRSCGRIIAFGARCACCLCNNARSWLSVNLVTQPLGFSLSEFRLTVASRTSVQGSSQQGFYQG